MFSDIEASLAALDELAAVTLIATGKTSPHGPHLAAFCVPERRVKGLSAQRLRTAAQAILPKYATPDDWFIIPALPLLPSGKVDRQALLTMSQKM